VAKPKKQEGVTQRTVRLSGLRPIMFDRYPGDNKTELMPEQKMYFAEDGKTLVVPSANILSFLCAENTKSAVKLFSDSRSYKTLAQMYLSYVSIEEYELPLRRKGKPIVFAGFGQNGVSLDRRVARVKGGIPNPKARPVVALPWELEFHLALYENDVFDETALRLMFERGGIASGLGTFRGVYGKFEVSLWK